MNLAALRILAVLAILVAVGWWQRHDGALAERAAWQTREAAELRSANAEILRIEEAARATERAHAAQMSTLSTQLQKEIQNVETRRQADVAAARAGTLVLRDPGPRESACPGDPAPPGATAGSGDGGAPGRLSPAASEFLLDLVADADAVVEQLRACQGVIRADRKGS